MLLALSGCLIRDLSNKVVFLHAGNTFYYCKYLLESTLKFEDFYFTK